jgi:hypothetical protein
MTVGSAVDELDLSRPNWLMDGRQRRPNGLNLASARCLQQPQTVAYLLLRPLIALPLVIEPQARPLIRIHRLELGHLEFAVGGWLRYEQRPIGPANSKVRVSLGRCGRLDGVGFNFVLRRILSATGKRHRERKGGEGQKLCSKRGQRAQTSGARSHATRCTVTRGRPTRDRHAHVSQFKARQVGRVCRAALIATPTSCSNRRLAPWPNAVIMDEEFEFHFNNYDESNVNRPCAEWPDGDNPLGAGSAAGALFKRFRINRTWACPANDMPE